MSTEDAGPAAARTGAGFLEPPPVTADVQRVLDADLEQLGFVMNLSRLWSLLPEARSTLFGLVDDAARTADLTFRQRGILVAACASTLGDSYCSLAWGTKLAGAAEDADLAAGVLRGEDPSDPAERALAAWARKVAGDPNRTGPEDVEELRAVGYDDQQIFAITLFVALRLAFATVNDALGAQPDPELAESAPAPVRDAVTFGRDPGR